MKGKEPAAAGHVHSHGVAANMGGRLVLALALTLFFVTGEFVAGLVSHSLALISDAGHNLTDALAVGFSLWAMSVAKREPTPDRTFGYHRAGILVAALNAGTLVLIALFIFYEAVNRLLHPQPVEGWIVIVVAAVAVLLNGAIAFMLSAGTSDLNVRSTFVHMAGDALSAAGVILAGIGILLTGWQLLDPLVSVLIGIFILFSSWGIVKEALNILMEGTPSGVQMAQLIGDMDGVPGVIAVHDVHVWTIGHDRRALSAHVNTGNCTVLESSRVFTEMNRMLETKYDIVHSTLQAECIDCDPNADYCRFGADGSFATGSSHAGHDHAGHTEQSHAGHASAGREAGKL